MLEIQMVFFQYGELIMICNFAPNYQIKFKLTKIGFLLKNKYYINLKVNNIFK